MSNRESSNTTRLRLEAYTDWLVVLSVTALIALDKVPWEYGLPVLAAVGGVAGVMKGSGKSGGAVVAIASFAGHPIAKLAALIMGTKGGT